MPRNGKFDSWRSRCIFIFPIALILAISSLFRSLILKKLFNEQYYGEIFQIEETHLAETCTFC